MPRVEWRVGRDGFIPAPKPFDGGSIVDHEPSSSSREHVHARQVGESFTDRLARCADHVRQITVRENSVDDQISRQGRVAVAIRQNAEHVSKALLNIPMSELTGQLLGVVKPTSYRCKKRHRQPRVILQIPLEVAKWNSVHYGVGAGLRGDTGNASRNE